jgi:L-ascorbate metabolism protein UlaG (beta-lactamase superfamily)
MYSPPAKYREPYLNNSLDQDDDALRVKWFGTAGFELIYRDTTLLIDPFFSRNSLLNCGFTALKNDPESFKPYIGKADHIIIGHSHHDHIMDVPEIALQTGALVSGSSTTANMCLGYGLPPEQLRTILPDTEVLCGDFKVRFIESLHGRLFGMVPSPGTVDTPSKWPLRLKQFKHGGVFGLHITAGPYTLFHNGSANLIDDKLAGHTADIHLMGLSGRRMTKNYLERFYSILQPKFIFPMHYDNFFIPLDKGLKLLPFLDMKGFYRDIEKLVDNTEIIMPVFLETTKFVTDGKLKASIEKA